MKRWLSTKNSVLPRGSISEKRTELMVRFILKRNRETVKDGMALRNQSKKMTEKCQFVEVATDALCPEWSELAEHHFVIF